jgi:hypothetical protein
MRWRGTMMRGRRMQQRMTCKKDGRQLSLPLHTTTSRWKEERMIFRRPFEASDMSFLSAANSRRSLFIFHATPRKPQLHSFLFFHGIYNSLQFLSWKWGSHYNLTPHDGSKTATPIFAKIPLQNQTYSINRIAECQPYSKYCWLACRTLKIPPQT